MISLSNNTIDRQDLEKLATWLLQDPTPQLSKGSLTKQFEEIFARWIGTKYAVYCNSGSSSNLMMIYSLIVANRLKNKKVIIPNLAWSTTISPVIQLGLEPILCDVNLDNLSVDLNHLEDILKTENPACLLLVSVLGLSPNIKAINELCNKYNCILLGDYCEALGTKYDNRKLGSCGELMSSYSLFYSHHICSIEGGVVTTNDKDIYDFLLMIRSHGWSRDLEVEKQRELQKKWNISDFNNMYSFYVPSFNLRATDLQAFIAIGQMEKVDSICEKRYHNFNLFQKYLKNDYWKPKPLENSWTSSFCIPIIHPERNKIINALERKNIAQRPLISGSMGCQPFYIERYGKKELPNSKIIDDYGLYVPNNQSLNESDIKYICNAINEITANESTAELHDRISSQK